MSDKVFKVGQKWKRRNGTVAVLAEVRETSGINDTDGCEYFSDGAVNIEGSHPCDLVCSETPKPEAKPLFHVGQEGVMTRDGRKVRILATDCKAGCPVIALLQGSDDIEYIGCYSLDGRINPGIKGNADLIPPPPPKQYAWVEVGQAVDGKLYARDLLRDHAVSKYKTNAVGCIRVELAERWDE